MISKTYTCHNCNSTNLVKNGSNRNGQARYKCKDCGVSRVLIHKPKYTQEQREEIIRAYMERSSIRGVCRIFGCSKQSIANWIKKKPKTCQTT